MSAESPSRPPVSSQAGHRRLSGLLRSEDGDPDAFGSERSFSPEIGANWSPKEPRGYYIDFRFKAEEPAWPPPWLGPLSGQLHVATIQWGLGAYERFLCGEGEEWLAAALEAGEHLVSIQQRGGRQDGGWRHFFPMPHTYRIDPPWISAIAQGEGASLLARLHGETGEERFGEAAARALRPLETPVAAGGTLADLDGAPFVEEYPTRPSSFVLNGAIFALWGYRDVGVALGDAATSARFEELATALAENLHRWDTGHWSRYDLYPHPVPNVASPAYHLLHIRQLEVLERLVPRPQFGAVKDRFQGYRASALCRRRAMAQKIGFRLLVPRNQALAHRLPWNAATRRSDGRRGRGADDVVLVLCYHAVSEGWDVPLAVTPGQLDSQILYLSRRGYRGVTFSEALQTPGRGRRVAVTFDDGCRSVTELARPILERHGMVGTVFVPTDHIGTEKPMSWPGVDRWIGGPHERELTPMSWEEAGELAAAGWEIGSHTRSHPQLTKLSDERLREELEGSRAECERRLGRPCETLAFPYGDVDERVMEAAMAAGYGAAAAVAATPEAPSPYRWPRVGVYRVDGERSFRLKVSRPVRRLQRSRGWGAIEALTRRFRPHEPAVE